MKKLLFLLLTIFSVSIGFAQNSSSSSVDFSDSKDASNTRKLIALGLEKNEELVSKLSLRLTNEQRNALYNHFKVSATLPTVANAFLGFGFGSDRQGDVWGGKFEFTTEVIGLSLSLIGPASYFITEIAKPDSNLQEPLLIVGLSTGAAIWLTGRIFGMIRPSYYAKKYNTTLGKALHIGEKSAKSEGAGNVSLLPIIEPVSGSCGFVASLYF